MVGITRSGVAHDLNISPYKLYICYGNSDERLGYVFSSQLYMDIFKKKLEENRENISKSLSKRFGFTIKNDKLCDLKLYSATEKRGFLILGVEEEYRCLNNLELNGEILTQRK